VTDDTARLRELDERHERCGYHSCAFRFLLDRLAAAEKEQDKRAAWLAQWIIDNKGGTPDLPAWVWRSKQYYIEACERAQAAESREREARANALEEAAKVCDAEASVITSRTHKWTVMRGAKAIRALAVLDHEPQTHKGQA